MRKEARDRLLSDARQRACDAATAAVMARIAKSQVITFCREAQAPDISDTARAELVTEAIANMDAIDAQIGIIRKLFIDQRFEENTHQIRIPEADSRRDAEIVEMSRAAAAIEEMSEITRAIEDYWRQMSQAGSARQCFIDLKRWIDRYDPQGNRTIATVHALINAKKEGDRRP